MSSLPTPEFYKYINESNRAVSMSGNLISENKTNNGKFIRTNNDADYDDSFGSFGFGSSVFLGGGGSFGGGGSSGGW